MSTIDPDDLIDRGLVERGVPLPVERHFKNEVLFTLPKKSTLFEAFKRFMTWRPNANNLFDTREPRQGGPGETATERTTEGGTAATMNSSTTGQPHEADR